MPKLSGENPLSIGEKIHDKKCSLKEIKISDFVNSESKGNIVFKPTFQRNFIWDKIKKWELIQSIFLGFPIGMIIGHSKDNFSKIDILDGHQRSRTIKEFVNSNFELPKIISKNIICAWFSKIKKENSFESNKIIENFNLKETKLVFAELPECLKKAFLDYKIHFMQIITKKDSIIRSYFQMLQNHDSLTAGEMIKSLPDEKKINDVIKIIFNEISPEFLSKHNDRQYLLELSFSILGVLKGKIQFGTTAKSVVNFAKSLEELQSYDNKILLKINKAYHLLMRFQKDLRIRKIPRFLFKVSLLYLILIKEFSKTEIKKMKFISDLSTDSQFINNEPRLLRRIKELKVNQHSLDFVKKAIKNFAEIITNVSFVDTLNKNFKEIKTKKCVVSVSKDKKTIKILSE